MAEYNRPANILGPKPLEPTVRLPGGETFSPGVMLMSEETGSGKSLTGAAMAIALNGLYWYVNEARGELVIDPTAFENKLKEKMDEASKSYAPMLIVDSLQVYLFMNTKLKEGIETTTFKGGLTPGHIVALMKLNDMAIEANCTIIAIVNEVLFPVGDLEGAVEGVVGIQAPGLVISKRDRSDREYHRIELSDDSKLVQEAAQALGYAKRREDGSFEEFQGTSGSVLA